MKFIILMIVFGWVIYNTNLNFNKKVLLRERKRHTARRAASTRHGMGTPSSHGGGYPTQSWWGGVLHPVMVGGYPGTPHPDLARGRGTPTSHGWGVPHPVMMGVPHPVMVGGTWVPLTIQTWPGGYPIQSSRYPPPSKPSRGSTLGTPTIRPGIGYPPPSDLGWGTPHHQT